MKKKHLIIIGIIALGAITILELYQTFALGGEITVDTSGSYIITVEDGTTVNVPAGSSETVYYKLTNTNKGIVQYGVGYSGTNITVKYYSDTQDPVTGTVDYGESKFIKLYIENNGSTTSTAALSTILGYEKGGDLIVPSGVTLITEELVKYYMKGYDTSFDEVSYINHECLNVAFNEEAEACLIEIGPKFLNSDISVAKVSTISVVKSSEVPSGVGSATDISKDQDGSVLLYSKTSSNKSEFNGLDLYDLYIATENGKVFLTNGAILFEYMINLKSVDLANMYTDEVTDMSGMFAGCLLLESIDASNFNTSNVTNMSGMFYGNCGVIGNSHTKEINISSFDTSNVTNMSRMFYWLYNLTTLDVSNFNTSNVTNMSYMFYWLYNLTTLDISNFNTSNVTNMSYMFFGMDNLTTLDISNFNTSNVVDMSNMFYGLKNLITIYASNTFTTLAVTDSAGMFTGCKKLVGGNGTKYNSSYIDKAYARIDTSSTPGYFTLKN
jgi:surface protein